MYSMGKSSSWRRKIHNSTVHRFEWVSWFDRIYSIEPVVHKFIEFIYHAVQFEQLSSWWCTGSEWKAYWCLPLGGLVELITKYLKNHNICYSMGGWIDAEVTACPTSVTPFLPYTPFPTPNFLPFYLQPKLKLIFKLKLYNSCRPMTW
jgi:hypothetical protein